MGQIIECITQLKGTEAHRLVKMSETQQSGADYRVHHKTKGRDKTELYRDFSDMSIMIRLFSSRENGQCEVLHYIPWIHT
jgi:hypothetical protein